jgi:lantibiotic transport system ATP-binding protein
MYCLETKNLTYQFSPKDRVLNAINLQVPNGSIYGFLGPNGAGKTTTLRLVLGLLRKQQGEISVFGKPFEDHRIDILKKVGSLIETPSLYGQLTAKENLQVLQKVYQCPSNRIDHVLKLVDLANTGTKKARQFSLGMKQRLSIAIALLNEPSLLILDEPTNGLDPNGIIEIRELLRNLNQECGISIVISSHLLSEIEKLVTHIGIINKGKMMFQGALAELVNKQTSSSYTIIETNNESKTLEMLKSQQLIAKTDNGKIILPVIEKQILAKLNQNLVSQGIEVYEMSTIKKDLESIFIDLVSH